VHLIGFIIRICHDARSSKSQLNRCCPLKFWKLVFTWITFKAPVRTAQKTHPVSVIKINQLVLYREIIAVCSQSHKTHKYTVWAELRITNTRSVPRSKHSVSVIKTSQLMLYREIIAVCSQRPTKHINTLCGQNGELYISSPYRAENTPRLGYKNQSVNAV